MYMHKQLTNFFCAYLFFLYRVSKEHCCIDQKNFEKGIINEEFGVVAP